MKTTITLNGITQEIELTQEQAKLFEKHKTGWERAKGQVYHYTDLYEEENTDYDTDINSEDDHKRYELGFYSSTKEHALRQFKIDSLRRRMQRFSDENYPDVEWDGKNLHYCITIHSDGVESKISWYWCNDYKEPFQIYFGTSEGAKEAIKLFGAELLELYK